MHSNLILSVLNSIQVLLNIVFIMNMSPLSFDGMFLLFSSLPTRVQYKFRRNNYHWDPE